MNPAGRVEPRVSVVTAVYNGEPFLERSLRTLLAQTHRDFEAVVIDDGSADGSAALVEALALRDARIRLFRQENTGIAGALNRGLREARGELVAFLDQDDLWHPKKLERQVAELDRDERVGFVGCFSALIDERGRSLGWRFGSAAHGDVYGEMLHCDLVAGGSVALVRRAALEAAGGFDPSPEIEGRSDWDMWLRLARTWHYASVDETLVGYTRSAGNYSRDYAKMLRAGEAVLAKAAASDPALTPGIIDRALARDAFGILCLCLADGAIVEARACLRRSLRLSWHPVVLSPKRWLGVVGVALASALPPSVYDRLWGVPARVGFGLAFREPFPEPEPAPLDRRSGRRERA